MKYCAVFVAAPLAKSPPARGAWIEMSRSDPAYSALSRRPPHGGRGLKYFVSSL